ncbi:hypothetical protein, partial [Halochromatium sp.]
RLMQRFYGMNAIRNNALCLFIARFLQRFLNRSSISSRILSDSTVSAIFIANWADRAPDQEAGVPAAL